MLIVVDTAEENNEHFQHRCLLKLDLILVGLEGPIDLLGSGFVLMERTPTALALLSKALSLHMSIPWYSSSVQFLVSTGGISDRDGM